MSKGTVNTPAAAVTVMLRRRRDRVPVGLLRFGTDGPRQFSLFRYAPSWLESPDAFALAPDLPLEDRDFPHSGRGYGRAMRAALPGPVSDGTPDSWGRGILRTVLGGRQDEKAFLLAVGDATRQGALGYADNTPLFAGYPGAHRGGRAHRIQHRLPGDRGRMAGPRPAHRPPGPPRRPRPGGQAGA